MTPEDQDLEEALDPLWHFGSYGIEGAPPCCGLVARGYGYLGCGVCELWWFSLPHQVRAAALACGRRSGKEKAVDSVGR